MSQDFCPDFRQRNVSEIGTKVMQFQTVSEIETVWEWDTTELSEIQTSSNFRHSLHLKEGLKSEQLLSEIHTSSDFRHLLCATICVVI